MQDKIAELVDQIPGLDKRGTFTGPSWDEALPILDGVLAAGRDGVAAVIAMVKEIDDGSDYKARYVLHALAQYVGRPGKESARTIVAEALAAKPSGYCARQLQVCGTKSQAPALGKMLSDPDLCEYAAQALLAIRDGAVEEFRKALPELKGAPRVTALQALGVLADAASADAFKAAIVDADADVRLIAGWALAKIGEGVDLVIKAADAGPGYERIKATSNALLLAERLLAAGKKAEAAKVYAHLKNTRTDASEAYVKDIASDGLVKAGG
jgi:HEAT repeat protein